MAVKVLVTHLARWSRLNVWILPGPLNALATGLAWSYFLAVLFLFDPIIRVAHLFGRRAMNGAMSVMCLFLHGVVYLSFSPLTIDGEEHAESGGPFLIVLNHQSFLEAVFMFSVLGHLRPVFICKRELAYGIPSVSYFLRNGGHSLIDRSDPAQSLKEVAQIGRRLDRGEVSPVFLPEGTRSKDGRLLRFKRAGFVQILEKAPRARVLPVIVDGGYALFPKGFRWIRAITPVRMRILPPETLAEGQDPRDFVVDLEARFRAELDRLRAGE